MSDIFISVKEKVYNNQNSTPAIQALKNIEISIRSKEFVSIVGPSGCGKTTLMNIIGGLVEANEQQIFINNKKKNNNNSFGYIFQTSRLMPWLTLFENVKLVCNPNSEIDQKVENILENFGLKDFIHAYPNTISGGMRRRASMARAFINNPEILLMDEPFVSLDQPAAEDLYNVLISYWRRNPTTILLITHSVKEAILLSNRILFMTKRPGSILIDYKVKSSRSILKIDNKEVEKEYSLLVKKFPQLLKGII